MIGQEKISGAGASFAVTPIKTLKQACAIAPWSGTAVTQTRIGSRNDRKGANSEPASLPRQSRS